MQRINNSEKLEIQRERINTSRVLKVCLNLNNIEKVKKVE